MAKLYGISGLATGKKGDNVFVVRNGCQIIRQYVPHIKDPKTPAQLAVRARTKLMSQLSVVYAPIVAMKRKKMCSPRMRFIERNYEMSHYDDGKADVLVQYLQLTDGFRYVPHFSVDRSSHEECVCQLEQDARSFLSAVVYSVVAIDGENRLRIIDSTIVTDAGENGLFEGSLAYDANALAVYCYGLYNFDAPADMVQYANLNGNAAAMVADLVALRSPLMRNAYLSQTKGCFLEVGVDQQSSRELSGVLVTVTAPEGFYYSGQGRYAVGDTVVIYHETPWGWVFDGYYVNNVLVGTGDTYEFTAEQDVTVEIRGHQDTSVQVQIYSSDMRKGTVSGGGTYNIGDSVTIVATPAQGYRFVGWYSQYTGVPDPQYLISTLATYTFTVQDGVSWIGVFVDDTATVTVQQSEEGVGTWTGGGSYTIGDTCTLVDTTGSGSSFVGWEVNGWLVSRDKSYSFVVTEDVTVKLVEITTGHRYIGMMAIGDENATIQGSGVYTSTGNVTVTVTPSNGHTLSKFVTQTGTVSNMVNGVEDTRAHWAGVRFALFTVPAAQEQVPVYVIGDNGVVSPNNEVLTVYKGQSSAALITLETGYVIDNAHLTSSGASSYESLTAQNPLRFNADGPAVLTILTYEE